MHRLSSMRHSALTSFRSHGRVARWAQRTLLCCLAGALCLSTPAALRAWAAGPEVSQKRWNDPALAKRIQDNIDKYRKGPATLEVVDAAGKPVSGVSVEVQQTSHEFLFGCNAFVLGQLKTPAANQLYEETFARLFNFTTVPFYWEGTEPKQGELRYQEGSSYMWRRPPPDRFLAFSKKYGITLKGHPLLWHACNPAWLPKDADELRELYRKRFREIAAKYADKITIWDVVNESLVCNPKYPLFTKDRAYVAWAFREVAPLFPATTTLMINEVNFSNFEPAAKSRYFAQIKALLAAGVPVRGIGYQFHHFRRKQLDAFLQSDNNDPQKMLDLYEAYGQFKLPLYITEITIPSAGPDGEALQAETVRNYYRLWFSAPMMRGVTWWNLGDNTAYGTENEAKGGLVDGDLKPKAAYRALDELVNHEWKTHAQAQTDAQGQTQFQGFYGKYQITLKRGDVVRRATIDHTQAGKKTYRLSLAE